MQRALTLSAMLLLLLTALSCGQEEVNPDLLYLKIASTTKDCQGFIPQKCLQVKEKDSDNFQYFYNQIQGFTHEEGYEYEVLVIRKDIKNPPADGFGSEYFLVKEISRTKK
ncbi:DUF4377 domain-containing protein [Fibrivirga algicola]|uniref:DUF4377 domain-containing protein n=1 Tax=Fibrivirga algicola TaxID=2950420 RepID=A0ABX0QG44_9BACT|nr:DUF4377 domain-containing protein [Fibrivirga algicola]NID11360.1 DUF4377 domain-containing protein [Fibrivirga algicola]